MKQVGDIGDDNIGHNIGHNTRDKAGNRQGISYCQELHREFKNSKFNISTHDLASQ